MERKWTPLWRLNRFGSQYSVSRCRSVCLSLFLPDLVSTHMSSVRKLCIFAGPLGCARKLTAGPDPLVHSAFLVSTTVWQWPEGGAWGGPYFPYSLSKHLAVPGWVPLPLPQALDRHPSSQLLYSLGFGICPSSFGVAVRKRGGSRASNQSNLLVTTLSNGWEPGLSQG